MLLLKLCKYVNKRSADIGGVNPSFQTTDLYNLIRYVINAYF